MFWQQVQTKHIEMKYNTIHAVYPTDTTFYSSSYVRGEAKKLI